MTILGHHELITFNSTPDIFIDSNDTTIETAVKFYPHYDPMSTTKHIYYYHNIQHINDYPFNSRSGLQMQIRQKKVTLYQGRPILLELLDLKILINGLKAEQKCKSINATLPARVEQGNFSLNFSLNGRFSF